MKASLAFAATLVVAVIVVSGIFITQQGATTTTGLGTVTTTSSSSESASTSISYGANATANDSNGIQIQLALRFYPGDGANGSVMVSIIAADHNTLPTMNNVTASTAWGLQGLSLGACGRGASPYGVALYSGAYTATNVSLAQPLQIYPVVPCPLYIRLVTGYLFQPASDNALILPGTGNATEMFSMVNATGMYSQVNSSVSAGMGSGPTSSLVPLAPGTYTAAAGDEWGAVVVTQFTIGTDGSASIIG
jgi:hypothetical protein